MEAYEAARAAAPPPLPPLDGRPVATMPAYGAVTVVQYLSYRDSLPASVSLALDAALCAEEAVTAAAAMATAAAANRERSKREHEAALEAREARGDVYGPPDLGDVNGPLF